jgi:hypothetical protein
MKLLRYAAPLAALLTLCGAPAQAGWDNVFQVACRNCRPREVRSSYYAPAPVASHSRTSYVENTYDEVITVEKPTLVREPVDVQVRSYYFDPVTTYTTRSYKNAAGCVEEVSVPCTRYVRKEECNTVTRYVERMKMVPTEVRRKVTERTPVTTITGPTTRSYSSDCENCGLPPASSGRAPRVEVERGDRLPPLDVNGVNRSKSVAPLPPAKPFTGTVNARTTSLATAVRGEVVGSDRATPKAGAKLVFLNDANYDEAVRVTADEYGNFLAQLPAGKWHVYVGNGQGRADLTTAVTVAAYDAKPLTVVSR